MPRCILALILGLAFVKMFFFHLRCSVYDVMCSMFPILVFVWMDISMCGFDLAYHVKSKKKGLT